MRWFRKVLCSFKNRVHRILFWCNPSASPSARAKRLRKITYSSSVKTIALSCPAKVHMLWIINVTQISRVIAYRVVKRDVWKVLDWCLKVALVEFASEFAKQHQILILLLQLIFFHPNTFLPTKFTKPIYLFHYSTWYLCPWKCLLYSKRPRWTEL